jgi:RHS repeat-associated protein
VSTINYVYNDANRLLSVGGVTYTYDDNGNLLNDGVNAYTYDSANRLTAVSNQQSASSYQYSGLGDRLSQTVNGVTTNYTLDLNSGLTQVLNDGTNTYVYGVDRIAQMNGGTPEYFLTDALGSMRQLVDSTGNVTLAKSYQPFGTGISSVGSGSSSYGFTGEMTDSTGLIYLRARYLVPTDGRFLTRDTWQGDYDRPLSLNRWMYVEGNPINFTDPSGYITEGQAKRADVLVEKFRYLYNIEIKRDWGKRPIPLFSSLPPSVTSYPDGCYWEEGNWRDISELEWTFEAVKEMTRALGGKPGLFRTAMKWRTITIYRISSETILDKGALTTVTEVIILPNNVFNSSTGEVWAKGQVVHEMAHAWDFRRWRGLSNEMTLLTGSFKKVCVNGPRGVQSCNLVYDPGGEAAPTGYAQTSPTEDWAESFKVFVYPSMGNLLSIRRGFIERVIKDFPFYP